MKKTLLSLVVISGMAASAASALTNLANSYYMPIEVGVYHTDATRNMNNSAFGSVGLGYNLTPVLAVQANAGMMDPQTDYTNQNLNGYLVDVEAKASLPTQTNIMPYAQFGQNKLDSTATVGLSWNFGAVSQLAKSSIVKGS
ncbi:MAG: hypothetical protein K0Q57_1009 [Gammaproteobacteria bacterium]|nr:hypothetical protein [Gammaproteobacteria bacterium]